MRFINLLRLQYFFTLLFHILQNIILLIVNVFYIIYNTYIHIHRYTGQRLDVVCTKLCICFFFSFPYVCDSLWSWRLYGVLALNKIFFVHLGRMYFLGNSQYFRRNLQKNWRNSRKIVNFTKKPFSFQWYSFVIAFPFSE